jgi:hypothetical protein
MADDGNDSIDVLDLDAADVDEKEWAFTTWVKNGQSTKLTHEETGIPLRTVQDWVTRYGWRRRLGDVLDSVTAEAVASARLAYALAVRAGADRLLTDLSNTELSPRDVRDHVTLLHRLATGDTAGQAGEVPYIDARQVHISPGSLTAEEARAISVQAIESNVDRSKVRKEGRRGYQ